MVLSECVQCLCLVFGFVLPASVFILAAHFVGVGCVLCCSLPFALCVFFLLRISSHQLESTMAQPEDEEIYEIAERNIQQLLSATEVECWRNYYIRNLRMQMKISNNQLCSGGSFHIMEELFTRLFEDYFASHVESVLKECDEDNFIDTFVRVWSQYVQKVTVLCESLDNYVS